MLLVFLVDLGVSEGRGFVFLVRRFYGEDGSFLETREEMGIWVNRIILIF